MVILAGLAKLQQDANLLTKKDVPLTGRFYTTFGTSIKFWHVLSPLCYSVLQLCSHLGASFCVFQGASKAARRDAPACLKIVKHPQAWSAKILPRGYTLAVYIQNNYRQTNKLHEFAQTHTTVQYMVCSNVPTQYETMSLYYWMLLGKLRGTLLRYETAEPCLM